MTMKPQIVGGLLGFVVAQVVLVLGLAMLLDVFGTHEGLATAMALIAGGLLLAMWWCVDPLVPDAGRLFTGAIKLIVLTVFCIYAAMTLYSVMTGQCEVQPFS